MVNHIDSMPPTEQTWADETLEAGESAYGHDHSPTLSIFIASTSPEQERFDLLVKQAEQLAQKMDALRKTVDQHRILHASTLPPLRQRHSSLLRDMTLWLDHRVKQGTLAIKQQRLMCRIICRLSIDFAKAGDKEMRALHDSYSDESLADIELAQAAQTQSYFEEMMGKSFGEEEPFETVDDVLHARFEHIRKESEARAKAKAARKSKRGRSAYMEQADQLLEDSESALRTIYRQLASALHPDREYDPAARTHKNQLMSDANTAYARRDLLALLQLQYQANLTDRKIASSLAQEKLASLNALLVERMKTMSRELRDIELHTAAEFVLAPSITITAASLKHHLTTLQKGLQADIALVKSDFAAVQTDKGLVRWLKEQEAFS